MSEPLPDLHAAPVLPTPGLPPSPGGTGQPWLSRHLRNFLALSMCGVVSYLAVVGHEQAQTALISAFTLLVGAIWGERAALRSASTTPER